MGLADDTEGHARSKAFEQGLEDWGWSVGKDLQIEYRFSGGDVARIQDAANEFAALKLDCVLAQSTPVAEVVVRTIQTTPIVFVAVTDPVGSGFVKSMSRPGGNATGFTVLQATITGKYLSILKELRPQIKRVTIIFNPVSAPGAGSFFLQPFLDAAKEFKVEPIVAQVHDRAEIESALAALAVLPDGGLIVMPDNFTSLYRQDFISLAAKFRIPTVYPYRYFAEGGGLLAYGVDTVDMFRRAADYVNRVLHGAKPSELPVQAPNKFELVINLKTAHTLGLVVPRILLAGADDVVE
ncbi:MAG TPA: ABC transporter substrate-binding protein [Xanthobacteraceae bacterium]|jgi:putative ABC transport system substrate-binding protein